MIIGFKNVFFLLDISVDLPWLRKGSRSSLILTVHDRPQGTHRAFQVSNLLFGWHFVPAVETTLEVCVLYNASNGVELSTGDIKVDSLSGYFWSFTQTTHKILSGEITLSPGS
jgi:hypothetical protein